MDRRRFIEFGAVTTGMVLTSKWRAALAAAQEGMPGATVETTAGKIRGLDQKGVLSFRGILYGASTEGSARFLPPAKPQPWTQVRDAFELGARCPQVVSPLIPEAAAVRSNEPMREDCLVLNVWTPSAGNTDKRPVMVWLHGGGYSVGSAGFTIVDDANLARSQDVVVVGVNHRLNVFGFLYLAEIGGEKYAHASNVGMLDIVAALEWVRDNIGAFGGDPSKVTIFGQSGGAGKVSTLMAMPSAKGLFHRAIVESGSEVKGVPRGDASAVAEKYLAKLGLKANQVDQAQNLPMEQLLTAMGNAGVPGNSELRLAPTTDGSTLPSDPFDPKAPEISADVPMIAGTVETEAAFFANQPLDPIDEVKLREELKQLMPKANGTQINSVIAAYRAGRPNISNRELELIVASDARFRQGVLTEAERKAAEQKAPVYMYYFTWHSPVRSGKLGAFHTIEIPFVFGNLELATPMTGAGLDRYALSERISGAWAAFARTGNPNHEGLANWPAFNLLERATMVFDNECKIVKDPNRDERKLLQVLTT
jgi:para-nitrobenzyl esterase